MLPRAILLIEDDDSGRELGLFNLRRAGYQAEGAADGEAGLGLFDPARHDLVITDVRMPGIDGLEVLRRIRARAPETPVIVITAYGDVELAVAAMKEGAVDFIGKPFNRDHLLLAVGRALERQHLRQEVARLRIRASGVERPIIHASAAMTRVLEIADRLAGSSAPALICGEGGTGKELIARRIHTHGERASGPFVVVQCAALTHEGAELELFGDRQRVGRIRQAEGGTLFLDAIHELPAAVQGRLLEVVERGRLTPVGGGGSIAAECRVLAATLPGARAGLRDDLLYRLAVVELEVPPLRDRPSDVPPLVAHFVAAASGERELEIPPALIEAMMRRPWPGNVRELENACERLVLLARGARLDPADLPEIAEAPVSGGLDRFLGELPEEGLSLVDLERQVIARVLALRRGNVSKAALYLRIPRHVLAYRMEKYGIRRPG
ncbi:MAG: sigma-54-dependent Fis family transcriptional regulator [Myxococcales bacterium]|nr:sigma-54-dependent Fis family transcriptional regulator [Myxococcales bacterium]MCB9703126.1 sigma-54-dependent Fis family transcriptional regulator [Myxococcales bacterium]